MTIEESSETPKREPEDELAGEAAWIAETAHKLARAATELKTELARRGKPTTFPRYQCVAELELALQTADRHAGAVVEALNPGRKV